MADMDEASPAAERGDRITMAVLVCAVLLFVGTGGVVAGNAVRALAGLPHHFGAAILVPLLLNVALLLIAWRRARPARERVSAATMRRGALPTSRDPLTGVLNRRSLGEQGAAMLADAARRRRGLALIAVEVNRTAGGADGLHRGEEAWTRQVVAELRTALPPSAIVSRLDERVFAGAFVFDPEVPTTATRVGERVAAAIALLTAGEDAGACIGAAGSNRSGGGIDALIRGAELALAAARTAADGRCAWFDPAMAQAVQTRDRMEHELRAAIAAGEVVPWFEPQVALADNRLLGFEVLARWHHPVHGIVEPGRFIPMAEETGLIADLSLAVIRQALQAAREWDASLTLAVNIAPAQLRDAWFAQKLIKLLSETGVPARRLQVEITERALFDNLPLAQSIAGSLKNQGVTLVLDDFGTGFSSLAHLRALPFDAVKIDTSFVLSMADSPDSAAIVTAIAGLGDSLNLPIAAEGVETQAAEERLRALGITTAQGWRYGKPMPVTGVRRLLAEKRMLATADESFRNRRLAG